MLAPWGNLSLYATSLIPSSAMYIPKFLHSSLPDWRATSELCLYFINFTKTSSQFQRHDLFDLCLVGLSTFREPIANCFSLAVALVVQILKHHVHEHHLWGYHHDRSVWWFVAIHQFKWCGTDGKVSKSVVPQFCQVKKIFPVTWLVHNETSEKLLQ